MSIAVPVLGPQSWYKSDFSFSRHCEGHTSFAMGMRRTIYTSASERLSRQQGQGKLLTLSSGLDFMEEDKMG